MAVSKRKQTKPKKPYPSFPLTAHNNGQWCKKIRGKIHFFGVWEDPQIALNSYLRIAEDLHAGRQPSASSLSSDDLTVKNVCNQYLTAQLEKAETNQIQPGTFEKCRKVVESFAKTVGSTRAVSDITPGDFQQFRNRLLRKGPTGKGKGLGVYALSRSITIVRSMFKYAYDMDIIDRPIKYGSGFDKPSFSQKRKSRQAEELKNGKRLFEPVEILAMLDTVKAPLRAMILLGINGGFGNTDCACLPIVAICWDRKVIEFDRPKTGIERVVSLWPETIDALRETLEKRPKPADRKAEKLVFLTAFGRPWVRDNLHQSDDTNLEKVVPIDAIQQEFNKLIRKLGFKRKGLGFYALRHTFRTWADETKDQHAIHRIMGHTIPGMSGIYVEEISLDRLRAVTEYVHGKLFSG